MNNRIHLKLFTDNFEDAIFGSANISNSAISDGLRPFNYEICGDAAKLENDNQLYLQKILNSSVLVTEEVINEISEQLLQHCNNQSLNILIFPIPQEIYLSNIKTTSSRFS